MGRTVIVYFFEKNAEFKFHMMNLPHVTSVSGYFSLISLMNVLKALKRLIMILK